MEGTPVQRVDKGIKVSFLLKGLLDSLKSVSDPQRSIFVSSLSHVGGEMRSLFQGVLWFTDPTAKGPSVDSPTTLKDLSPNKNFPDLQDPVPSSLYSLLETHTSYWSKGSSTGRVLYWTDGVIKPSDGRPSPGPNHEPQFPGSAPPPPKSSQGLKEDTKE